MKYIFILTLSLFFSHDSFAQDKTCLQGIIKWDKLLNGVTKQQIECIAEHEESKSSIEGLCTADQKNFSPQFVAYLGYDEKYKELEKTLKEGWDDETNRFITMLKMRNLESEWTVLGFKYEVDSLLFALGVAKRSCESL